ncbi:MAG: hypothetical protein HS117_00335 [Verrucomicrobiaceae bacterium]|nr:hypothetical protein [Verrucomicrobiaceae bacterium]
MKCPRCRCAVQSGIEFCRECGFSAATLQAYLGGQWVRLERITDAAHCLRLEAIRHLEVVLDDFERGFPQAFFAVYLGVLPNGLSVGELGFWLLNQGAFNTPQVAKRNDFGTILVLDPSTGAAAVTFGYAIEEYFTARNFAGVLKRARDQVRHQDPAGMVETLVAGVSSILRRQARLVRWVPDLTEGASIRVQPLKGGHRATVKPTQALVSGMHSPHPFDGS